MTLASTLNTLNKLSCACLVYFLTQKKVDTLAKPPRGYWRRHQCISNFYLFIFFFLFNVLKPPNVFLKCCSKWAMVFDHHYVAQSHGCVFVCKKQSCWNKRERRWILECGWRKVLEHDLRPEGIKYGNEVRKGGEIRESFITMVICIEIFIAFCGTNDCNWVIGLFIYRSQRIYFVLLFLKSIYLFIY